MTHGLGWNPDLEAQHAATFAALERPCCAVSDSEIPETADPLGTIPVNDQGQRNSCTGNATDKVLEFDHWLQTGCIVNLSARFSYLSARIQDGTNDGPDAGASISGTALATKERGCCLEEAFPYWKAGEHFDPTVPDSVLALARDHRLQSAAPIRSVDDMIRFIGSGQGGVVFGVDWTDTMANYNGGGPLARDRGRSLGGHAMCFIGYRTVEGVKFPRLYNSHSERWGERGTALVEPELVQRWMSQSPYGFYGLSGLPEFVKRGYRMSKGFF